MAGRRGLGESHDSDVAFRHGADRSVATGALDASSGPPTLTAQQKMAATAPLVRSATEYIVRAVVADPRHTVVGDKVVLVDPTRMRVVDTIGPLPQQ